MNIAIMGATGAIGREMLLVLEERNIKADKITLLASARSKGIEIPYQDQMLVVEELTPNSFEGVDYVLGAVSNELTKEMAPYIKKSGAVLIDNSSAFRLDANVPLVVPEINPQDALVNEGIIANPNCSTIIVLMAIQSLQKQFGLKSMVVSTYQAVSGVGVLGVEELYSQTKAYLTDEEMESKAFSQPIAFNVIPVIGSELGDHFTTEEVKMQNEGRKILHEPELIVNCTCVRVPVLRSHSASVTFTLNNQASFEQIEQALSNAEGIRYVAFSEATPLNTSNQDLVHVSRLRVDETRPNESSYTLWCCGDQIRKGAASNAVQILELLLA